MADGLRNLFTTPRANNARAAATPYSRPGSILNRFTSWLRGKSNEADEEPAPTPLRHTTDHVPPAEGQAKSPEATSPAEIVSTLKEWKAKVLPWLSRLTT